MSQTFEDIRDFRDPVALIRVLAEHSPVGVQIFDSNGYSVYANDHHRRMYGGAPPPTYSVLKDEVAGAAGILPLIHQAFSGQPTKMPVFWYDVRELKDLDPSDRDYVLKTGKRCATETTMVPVLDAGGKVSHVVAFHKDVTGEMFMKEERETALKERDDAKALIQNVLDQTKVVIYIKDLDGKFVFVNSQFCRIFDTRADRVLGKGDYDLFPKELADRYRENDLHVQKTLSHHEAEETALHADGTSHIYLSLKFPLHDSSGALYGICGISTDITQYRAAERELNAARRIQTVGVLAGGVAHNFNNLLGIILLIADTLLAKERLPETDWRTPVKSLKDAAESAISLTRQLLAFGRWQASKPCAMDLGTAVSGMKELLEQALREDILLSIEIGPSIRSIYADPVQVEQVLANLCLNARDAMPRGGTLAISIQNRSLSPEQGKWRIGRPSGEFVELRVTDSGVGMSAETLERIFEPFFTTKKEGEGTGLGLATVYGIMQGAGGDIAVESVPGQGTTFCVYFPQSAEAPVARTQALERDLDSCGGDETLLIVEDQGTLRHTTAKILREHGYTVIEARDGKAALNLWPSISDQVDLVISDMVMPGMNGLEMAEEISKCSPKPVKVLFLSAYSEKLRDSRGVAAGPLMEKPYTAQTLLKKLRELLD